MSVRSPQRLFVALISLSTVLCGACATTSAPTPTPGNQTLIVDENFNYDDLDPALGVYSTANIVNKSVYDTLTIVNPKDLSKPYPSLATSFTVSPDAKTTTFTLRQGVKFASGNPLTSADVVWSLTRLTVVGQQSGQNYVMQDPGGNDMGVMASDPYTVVIHSQAPDPAVAMQMTMMNAAIIDSVLAQQHGATNTSKNNAEDFFNSTSAGSGPYVIQSVDRTSQIILQANTNYWGAKPAYSKVIMRNAPTATQRFDVQDGQAQLAIDISSQDAASLNASAVNVTTAPSADQLYLILNARPSVLPWVGDQNFRDAVRYALDYQGLVALAGKGTAQGTGFIPNGILGSLPSSSVPQRDLARARAALAQVGAVNPTFTLEYPTDVSLDGRALEPFATKIQSDLKDVGITVNLLGEPQAIWGARFQAGKVQSRIGYNNGDFPDPDAFVPINAVVPGSDTTQDNWVPGMDPSLDALTAAALAATTPADRAPAFQALEQAMNSKGYFDFILQPARTLVAAKSVHASINPFTTVDLGFVT
jgi:peptide/nickel transport system substrate-binding protein